MPRQCSVLFVDASISVRILLLTGIEPGIHAHILWNDRDGVTQITSILFNFYAERELDNIHVIAPGAPGCLALGNSKLSLSTIAENARSLTQWNAKSITLHGCNVATGDAGEEFVDKLSTLTGSQISASSTSLGSAALGGN